MKTVFLKSAFSKLADALFPKGKTCVNCKNELIAKTRYNLCADCIEKLPYVGEHRCISCGIEINNEADYCISCQNYDHFFEKNRAPLKYEGIGECLIKKLKFGGKRYLAEELGKLMTDEYIAVQFPCEVVTFVPMSGSEEKERGFNQAELLAKEVSKRLNMPLLTLLAKVRDTSGQKHLSGRERRDNLKGVFAVTDQKEAKGKTILIVDDVFTTGATINECARTLKRGGAKAVYSLTACVTQYKLPTE
jgi:Predicted amidophosphoribosyltransferases